MTLGALHGCQTTKSNDEEAIFFGEGLTNRQIWPILQIRGLEVPVETSRTNWFEARARVLKALANQNRLILLDELSRGEKCVAELTKMVGLDMSTISKHLSILKAVGLVQDERRGAQVFYSLAAPCVLGFFDCVESVLQAQVQRRIQLGE